MEGEEDEGDREEEYGMEETTEWDGVDGGKWSEVICRMLIVAEEIRGFGSMGILELPVVLYQQHAHDDACTSEDNRDQVQGVLD